MADRIWLGVLFSWHTTCTNVSPGKNKIWTNIKPAWHHATRVYEEMWLFQLLLVGICIFISREHLATCWRSNQGVLSRHCYVITWVCSGGIKNNKNANNWGGQCHIIASLLTFIANLSHGCLFGFGTVPKCIEWSTLLLCRRANHLWLFMHPISLVRLAAVPSHLSDNRESESVLRRLGSCSLVC